MYRLAERFLSEWNSQEVDRVVGVYTHDVVYVDPNTRGAVKGSDALRRYLTKLLARWKMHWSLREAHLFEDKIGCAVLWHATIQRAEGGETVEMDGMDFVRVRGDKVERNEVYFDRTILATLMG
ncbi:nuclear transport factor 2 family protein [Candidatus Poribacteria bacterium]|nr:nuclear transport factor 2 family protein [Candidatus Poribacteria bacterium]